MKATPETIDSILPQTQCGLCGYGGCMPYAKAIVFEKAGINLCPPGGIETLNKLAKLTQQDATPYLAEMSEKAKPKTVAVIREAECIGCTKCIQACPVDAILGGAKAMHTVISDECTGCELCVSPCPVDCIDIISFPEKNIEDEKKDIARKRFQARNRRLANENEKKKAALELQSILKKKNYIADAIMRAKLKRKTTCSLPLSPSQPPQST